MAKQDALQRRAKKSAEKKPVRSVIPKGLNTGEKAAIGRQYGAKTIPKGPARAMAAQKKSYSDREIKRLGALERRMGENSALKKNPSGTTPTGAPLKPGKLTEQQKTRYTATKDLFKSTNYKQRQKENKHGMSAMEKIRLATSNKKGDKLQALKEKLQTTTHQQRAKGNVSGGFKKPHTGTVGPKKP